MKYSARLQRGRPGADSGILPGLRLGQSMPEPAKRRLPVEPRSLILRSDFGAARIQSATTIVFDSRNAERPTPAPAALRQKVSGSHVYTCCIVSVSLCGRQTEQQYSELALSAPALARGRCGLLSASWRLLVMFQSSP